MRKYFQMGLALVFLVILSSCGRDSNCPTYNPGDPTCAASNNQTSSYGYGAQGNGYQDPYGQNSGYGQTSNGYGNSNGYSN